jgi:hypothetical protein
MGFLGYKAKITYLNIKKAINNNKNISYKK